MDAICSRERTEKYRYLRNLEKALKDVQPRPGITDLHSYRLIAEIERTRHELRRADG